MKFNLRVRHKGETTSWLEEMDYPDVNNQVEAELKGKELVKFFNSTLHSKELPREFVSAEIINDGEIDHQWEKQNLVTIIKGLRSFDVYKCVVCGCEGRRYGLAEGITRTGKWKPLKYSKCKSNGESK